MSALALAITLLFAEPPPPEQPPEGGFGSVGAVTTDSNVVAPQPTVPEEETEAPRELSLRAEIGYGQASLANLERLDHQGMSLRAHLAFYPWLSKLRRVGVGIGLVYAYQGLNRKRLPADAGLERSKGQQQAVMLSVPLLFRPHAQWFSIQPSGMFGLGFYSGGDLWAADRRATIPRGEYAFVAGGDLALCTAWDIVCVVGGSEYVAGILTLATSNTIDSTIDTTEPTRRVISPWSWHVGVGVDVLRMIERGNRGA